MLLEDLFLFAFVIGISVLIGRPAFKLYRRFVPAKRNPVAIKAARDLQVTAHP